MVDERWRFSIVDISLHHGRIWYTARAWGPIEARRGETAQVIVYGRDGSEIFHARVSEDWAWESTADGSVTIDIPQQVIEAIGERTVEAW